MKVLAALKAYNDRCCRLPTSQLAYCYYHPLSLVRRESHHRLRVLTSFHWYQASDQLDHDDQYSTDWLLLRVI